MSMATGVSICSNALLMLGAQTINDFADQLNLDRAKLCANLYPTVRDDMLRSHPWNCAIKRAVLAPDAVAPAFGYTYSFELPADFLRVLEVGSCRRLHQQRFCSDDLGRKVRPEPVCR